MKVLVIGNGWIGNRLKEMWPDAIIVDAFTKVENLITEFDVLINAASKTDIDYCEKNKLVAFASNTELAHDLAKLCLYQNKQYVYLSSACIFASRDRKDVKTENSTPNPQCFYALTKWMGEELIMATNPSSLVVRIRLPLSGIPHPRNTITKLLSYSHLNNARETVTVIEDFLPVFKELVERKEKGIFHLMNAGTISPSEIGTAFGHSFVETTKHEQDMRLKSEGRAKRVTTIARSTRIKPLPNIRKRLPELVLQYKSWKGTFSQPQ